VQSEQVRPVPGGGQGEGVQVVEPLAAAAVPVGQRVPGIAREQTPVIALQQAVGWGQGWGEHVPELVALADVPAGHPAAVPMEQAPVTLSQHATKPVVIVRT
jgi:hypothetical protein